MIGAINDGVRLLHADLKLVFRRSRVLRARNHAPVYYLNIIAET